MTSHQRIKAAKGNREWHWSTSIKYLTLCQWNCTELETIGSESRFVLHWNHGIASLTEWFHIQRGEKTTELGYCKGTINIPRSFNLFLQLTFSNDPDFLSNFCDFTICKGKKSYMSCTNPLTMWYNKSFLFWEGPQSDKLKHACIDSRLTAYWLVRTAYVFKIYGLNIHKSSHSVRQTKEKW